MLVPFDSLPAESRVYYYPSSRKLYPKEVPALKKKVEDFCEDLVDSHIGFQLVHDRFLVFFVSDDTPLSMDQNDALVEFVLDLEKEFELSLLDKVNVCFKQGQFVQRKEVKEFKKLIKSRSVSGKTLVFDPMILTKSDFLTNWEVPLSESWLSHLV
jgi:hypothetical protein